MRSQSRKAILGGVLLAAGSGVLGYNIWQQSQGPAAYTGPEESLDDEDLPPMDDVPEEAEDSSSESSDAFAQGSGGAAKRLGIDLLAICGSFEQGSDVPNRFRAADAQASSAPPAPGAESQRADTIFWDTEPDPPEIVVSLTMCTGSIARASVDGQVVGVGDRVAAGRVTRIEKQGIEVDTGRYRLFYDMEMPQPREFRAEFARRLAEQQESETQAGDEDLATEDSADPSAGDAGDQSTERK